MLARKKLDQISLDLLRAAEVLERDGWAVGERFDWEGRRCLLGALDQAIGNGNFITSSTPLTKRLVKAIDLQPEQGGHDPYNCDNVKINSDDCAIIAYWNNCICKDEVEAIDKLREAAYL